MKKLRVYSPNDINLGLVIVGVILVVTLLGLRQSASPQNLSFLELRYYCHNHYQEFEVAANPTIAQDTSICVKDHGIVPTYNGMICATKPSDTQELPLPC